MNTLRSEVLAELHAMLDYYPVGSHRNIVKAARYIQDGKMDETLANAGTADTAELADLAIALCQVR